MPDLKFGEYPGKINLMLDGSKTANGCTAVVFRDGQGLTAAERMDAFFREHSNRLVVQATPMVDEMGHMTILCLYTKVVSDEELDWFNEVQSEVQKQMEIRRAARQKAADEQEAKQLEQIREMERLADVGRKCEENHKALAKKLREGRE